jgi:hypothetical protein
VREWIASGEVRRQQRDQDGVRAHPG